MGNVTRGIRHSSLCVWLWFWDCQPVTWLTMMFITYWNVFFCLFGFFVLFLAESWHRGTERAWRAERKPSPTDIWEETTSTHSEKCCPHYKAYCSGGTGPVCQWHACFLWPILPGVLTAGRVVSFICISDFFFFYVFSYTFVLSVNEQCLNWVVYKAMGVKRDEISAAALEYFDNQVLLSKQSVRLIVASSAGEISNPRGFLKWRYHCC